jgi:cytidyltransferase-like protein
MKSITSRLIIVTSVFCIFSEISAISLLFFIGSELKVPLLVFVISFPILYLSFSLVLTRKISNEIIKKTIKKESQKRNIGYAEIMKLDEFIKIKPKLGRIVCASGGFDPLHPGHTSYIIESKKYGDTLVVIVNGDSFLERKEKGRPFMDLEARCQVISSLREVNYVIPYEIKSEDTTVCEALRKIHPHVFTKGGDRSTSFDERERLLCEELNITVVLTVGDAKKYSSSNLLKQWGEYWCDNHDYLVSVSRGDS